MLPPAPGRLSTMTGWPSAWARGSEMARASASGEEPAGKGTTIWMGRSGQLDWADAEAAVRPAQARPSSDWDIKRRKLASNDMVRFSKISTNSLLGARKGLAALLAQPWTGGAPTGVQLLSCLASRASSSLTAWRGESW